MHSWRGGKIAGNSFFWLQNVPCWCVLGLRWFVSSASLWHRHELSKWDLGMHLVVSWGVLTQVCRHLATVRGPLFEKHPPPHLKSKQTKKTRSCCIVQNVLNFCFLASETMGLRVCIPNPGIAGVHPKPGFLPTPCSVNCNLISAFLKNLDVG